MPPPTADGGGIMFSGRPSVRPSVVRKHLFRATRYLFTQWTDFNETCHKYSSCKWALLKWFSWSTVKGQDHICQMYYYNSYSYSLEGAISCVHICEFYNGGGIHFDGVTSRLTLLEPPCVLCIVLILILILY